MVNYRNGKMHKIEAFNAVDSNGDIYIGSTTKLYLSQRMDCHRKDYVQWKKGNIRNGKITSFDVFDTFGIDKGQIILIETFPCDSKDELTSREAFYIES